MLVLNEKKNSHKLKLSRNINIAEFDGRCCSIRKQNFIVKAQNAAH